MPTYTFQPAEAVGEDSILNSGDPTGNFSTQNNLYVGEANDSAYVSRSVLRFAEISTIPATEIVISATLSLWTESDYSDNTRTMRAYRMLKDWVESQVTYNIYKTSNNWTTAGGFDAADCEQTDIGSVSVLHNESLNTEIQIALTPAGVQAWINGTLTNNGLLLKMDTEANDQWRFHSASSAAAGYRPKLVIVTEVASSAFFAMF